MLTFYITSPIHKAHPPHTVHPHLHTPHAHHTPSPKHISRPSHTVQPHLHTPHAHHTPSPKHISRPSHTIQPLLPYSTSRTAPHTYRTLTAHGEGRPGRSYHIVMNALVGFILVPSIHWYSDIVNV